MNSVLVRAFILFACCIAASVAVTSTWGRHEKGEKLMYTELIDLRAIPGRIVYRDLTHPTVVNKNSKNITYIEVSDQFRNNSGGYSAVWYGGINQKYVTMRFQSQSPGWPVKLLLRILGK